MAPSQCGCNHELPRHTLTKIKIEHERVRLFNVVDLQPHDTDLHQTQQAL